VQGSGKRRRKKCSTISNNLGDTQLIREVQAGIIYCGEESIKFNTVIRIIYLVKCQWEGEPTNTIFFLNCKCK